MFVILGKKIVKSGQHVKVAIKNTKNFKCTQIFFCLYDFYVLHFKDKYYKYTMKWTNMINKEKYQEFQMYTNIFFVYKVFKCFISKIEWNGQIWLKKNIPKISNVH
jgi:hypothetical protein